jgi:hypothetical protein
VLRKYLQGLEENSIDELYEPRLQGSLGECGETGVLTRKSRASLMYTLDIGFGSPNFHALGIFLPVE